MSRLEEIHAAIKHQGKHSYKEVHLSFSEARYLLRVAKAAGFLVEVGNDDALSDLAAASWPEAWDRLERALRETPEDENSWV